MEAKGSASSATNRRLRRETLRALAQLEHADGDLASQLRTLQMIVGRAQRHIQKGGRASDISVVGDVSRQRAAVSAAITRIEQARHRAHRAIFQLAAHEGTTLATIARTWGISRQLVSRIVNEPDRQKRSGKTAADRGTTRRR